MDINGIMQIIGSLGFPIVACIFLFRQNINIEEKHTNEMKSIIEAINNNTIALTKLSERLDNHDSNEKT